VQSGRQLPLSGRNTTIALTFEVKVNRREWLYVYMRWGEWERWVMEDRRPITIRWGRENMP